MNKIKLIVADFDGVICDLSESHYEALNEALLTVDTKFCINKPDQIDRFEGLTTKTKLNILVKERGFPEEQIKEVFDLKQKFTTQAIANTVSYNPLLVSTFSKLKEEGFLLYVASNSIRDTLIAGLTKIGIISFFDKILSNEDVQFPKPHPQIYLKSMVEAGVSPDETLILEDSKNGREAAVKSKAHVLDIDRVSDTNYENIKEAIALVAKCQQNKLPKWSARRSLNVLIPMSGAGSRLRALYKLPKPLIDIAGKTMIERVIDSLNIEANYIFIVQNEHYENYNLGAYLNFIAPDCTIVKSNGITEGAACSTLLAKEFINNNKHLLIANSDQLITWDSANFMYDMICSKVDGGVITFEKENDPKWSYVGFDQNGLINRVVEKQPISNRATIGLYYFDKGQDYVQAAEEMIAANDRVNSEFYVAPAINYMIRKGAKIKSYDIKNEDFMPTGTIEDLEIVLKKFNV